MGHLIATWSTFVLLTAFLFRDTDGGWSCSIYFPDGSCIGDYICVNGLCVVPCSPVHWSGYCKKDFDRCIRGNCTSPCSHDKPRGYCDDWYKCIDGRCQRTAGMTVAQIVGTVIGNIIGLGLICCCCYFCCCRRDSTTTVVHTTPAAPSVNVTNVGVVSGFPTQPSYQNVGPSYPPGYPPSNPPGYPPSNPPGYPPSNPPGYPPSNPPGYQPTPPPPEYNTFCK